MNWNEKMVRCVMTLILAVRSNIKLMMILNLYLVPLKKKTRDKLYIWISETTNEKNYLVEGNNFFYFSENG